MLWIAAIIPIDKFDRTSFHAQNGKMPKIVYKLGIFFHFGHENGPVDQIRWCQSIEWPPIGEDDVWQYWNFWKITKQFCQLRATNPFTNACRSVTLTPNRRPSPVFIFFSEIVPGNLKSTQIDNQNCQKYWNTCTRKSISKKRSSEHHLKII